METMNVDEKRAPAKDLLLRIRQNDKMTKNPSFLDFGKKDKIYQCNYREFFYTLFTREGIMHESKLTNSLRYMYHATIFRFAGRHNEEIKELKNKLHVEFCVSSYMSELYHRPYHDIRGLNFEDEKFKSLFLLKHSDLLIVKNK